MTNAPNATKNGTTQAKDSSEKTNLATADAAALTKNSYSAVLQGAQDYNNKVVEFAKTNTVAALDFVKKLSDVKSPSAFIELSTEHSREQFETLTEQTKELAALAHKVTLATTEPLKTGTSKALS